MKTTTMNDSFVILSLNIFAFIFLIGKSSAFINGFPKERCDDMDPTKIKLSDAGNKGTPTDADYNNTTDFVTEDSPPTSVQLSESLNLYRIVTSTPKYKRGGTLDITIRGREFNAFMLQVRKIGADERRGFDQAVRVGEFVSFPASVQPVMCDKTQATAVTNKNYAPKTGVVVKWKAPKEDAGEVIIVARFVAGDEYWQLTESREISMSEFPVNLNSCGKAKSCVLYSEKSASCHEDNCDYILTYNVVNKTSVEFVLGGTAKTDLSYLAVGFSTTPEAEDMKFVACTRAKTAAEIRFFGLGTPEEGMMELPMDLDKKKMDIEGDRMWCSFVVPMVTQLDGGQTFDLSIPLYQVYMRGNTNNTKSTNYPILPSKLLISKKEIQVDKIKLQYHTMEKTKQGDSSGMQQVAYHQLVTLVTFIQLWLLAKRVL